MNIVRTELGVSTDEQALILIGQKVREVKDLEYLASIVVQLNRLPQGMSAKQISLALEEQVVSSGSQRGVL
jgi:hypothetical protein